MKNNQNGITLVALVITIVLNCYRAAMERMLEKVKILKIYKILSIIYYDNLKVVNILEGSLFL